VYVLQLALQNIVPQLESADIDSSMISSARPSILVRTCEWAVARERCRYRSDQHRSAQSVSRATPRSITCG